MKTRVLLIGDLVMLILFAFLGQSEHKTITNFAGTLRTAEPFLMAWLFISVLAGMYNRADYRSFSDMFKWTIPVWVIAIPFGLGLRWLFTGRPVPFSFFLVAMISTFILLILWRTIFVWVTKRRYT